MRAWRQKVWSSCEDFVEDGLVRFNGAGPVVNEASRPCVLRQPLTTWPAVIQLPDRRGHLFAVARFHDQTAIVGAGNVGCLAVGFDSCDERAPGDEDSVQLARHDVAGKAALE